MSRRPTPLVHRIDAALAGGPMSFYGLAHVLYPNGRSWRYQANGGPPGCYMALSAALRRGKFHVSMSATPGPQNRMVYPRTPKGN
jgi:hypothetical protein